MPHLLVIGAGPGISSATAPAGRRGLRRRPRRPARGSARRARPALLGGRRRRRGRPPRRAPRPLTAAVDRSSTRSAPSTSCSTTSRSAARPRPGTGPEDLLADLAAGAVGLQTAVRAVLPGMRERGSGTVLVTGSGSADRPMPPWRPSVCRRRRCARSWRCRPGAGARGHARRDRDHSAGWWGGPADPPRPDRRPLCGAGGRDRGAPRELAHRRRRHAVSTGCSGRHRAVLPP